MLALIRFIYSCRDNGKCSHRLREFIGNYLVKLPPFIVTIGMAYIARGLAFVITEGFTIRVTNQFVSGIANEYVGPIPVMTIIMLVIVVIFSYILSSTPFGMKTKAVGGNIVAARLSESTPQGIEFWFTHWVDYYAE